MRLNISEFIFSKLAELLSGSQRGKAIVDFFMKRLGFWQQAWSLLLTLAFVLLIRATVITAFYIPSPSMINTLKLYDRVFVFRLAYLFTEPKIGDIVVFNVPETIPQYDPAKPIWIKRIVGIAGDRVAIKDNHLIVNGNVLSEPAFFRQNQYFDHLQNGEKYQETTVPEGHVLVFGDNSANSYDSRYWGPIPEDRIIGKAFVRFWPLSRLGPLHGESVNPFPPGALLSTSTPLQQQTP